MSSQALDALKQAMSKSGLTKAFISESSGSDGIGPLDCTGQCQSCTTCTTCVNSVNGCSLF